jgi:hypothetical protein
LRIFGCAASRLKIARGTNECGIEETPAAGMPGEVVAATPLTPPK